MEENKDTTEKQKFILTEKVSEVTVKKQNTEQEVRVKWQDLFMVMLALDILLLIFAVVIAVVWNQEVSTLSFEETNHICLPCSDIKVHKDEDDINKQQFERLQEQGTEICCADNEEKLDKLIELFVDRNYRTKRANGSEIPNCISSLESTTGNSEKPLARLTGVLSTPKDYSSYIIHWDDKSDPSHIGPHLQYSDGRFTIGQAGYYHVYSQVTFADKKVEDVRQYSTRQYIYHRRKKAPKKSQMSLIHSATPKCQLKSDHTYSSNYIGAVVYLDEGDEVGVKITEQNRISSSRYSNYFGLHAV